MIEELVNIRRSLLKLKADIESNKDLPLPKDFIATMIALNDAHSALVALGIALGKRHKERHPMAKIEVDMSPTKPLDPETRQAIDETP